MCSFHKQNSKAEEKLNSNVKHCYTVILNNYFKCFTNTEEFTDNDCVVYILCNENNTVTIEIVWHQKELLEVICLLCVNV